MPYDTSMAAKLSTGAGRRAFVKRHRWPLLVIGLPTILAAVYYMVFAADQYVSEASFLIRSTQPQGQAASLLGEVLAGGDGGGQSFAPEEASGVVDFLTSHDAAQKLQADIDIISIYRRAPLDFLYRIKAHPKQEELTKYFGRQVKVSLDKGSGIVKLEVRAFRPSDAKLITEDLLSMSESLVRQFSARAEGDAIKIAGDEVDRARAKLAAFGGDPNSSATTSVAVMGGLATQLAAAKAELTASSGFLRPGSAQLQALQARIAGLQSQIETQRANLVAAGAGRAVYDRAISDREAAMREYQAALAAFQAAQLDAQKHHLYLVRVVEPNLAEKSLYPQRGLMILTVFVCMCVAYGIGWLIVTGTLEHGA